MIFQAHRGVCTEAPENTLASVNAAILQGYKSIEIDVEFTKDGVPVLLHDKVLNRTARHADGSVLDTEVNICDIDFAEAQSYDMGIAKSLKFRGERIPALSEVLSVAKAAGVRLKIDNKYQHLTDELRDKLFFALEGYETTACLTCSDIRHIRAAAERFPAMHLHYDGAVSEETLRKLSAFLPKERITVWLPLESEKTAWAKVPFACDKLAELVKEYAGLGIWLLSESCELAEAQRLGADIIETDGQLKPKLNKGIIADMHTHSECSHDSVCPLGDMRESQSQKGTAIFASTDHCDILSVTDYDIFDTVRRSTVNSAALKGFGVLVGVEISEGFWLPEVYDGIMALADYDVVIGSVHVVEYKVREAYSQTDFSAFTDTEIEEFLAIYFADVLYMVKTTEMDILAHLTCPLRYIVGKYKRQVNMEKFLPVIDEILSLIIQKGIALEVNTSSFGTLSDFMPSGDIIARYRALGGYLVTLGSDAHVAENASFSFREALKFLLGAGFLNIFYLKNRKIVQCRIDCASF